MRGSSPHTRGARTRGSCPSTGRGIIPAYAGSTSMTGSRSSSSADHPRIRGEHQTMSVEQSVANGSSPHTRGAPDTGLVTDLPARIIPAYAGSTAAVEAVSVRDPDHPRIRGEHETDTTTSRLRAGSSPHTRGARGTKTPPHSPLRIIPAYAGSTGRSSCRRARPGDHPRIRGEHCLGVSERLFGDRIIPAYAGSTGWGRRIPRTCKDHPRIRGEHFPTPGGTGPCQGSSPHTRGALR